MYIVPNKNYFLLPSLKRKIGVVNKQIIAVFDLFFTTAFKFFY